jgi:hypothetical protein
MIEALKNERIIEMRTYNVKDHERTIIMAEVKNGKLVYNAIKIMKDDTDFKKSATLDSKAIADLRNQKSYHDFRNVLVKKYRVPNLLEVDSRAKKAGLTLNTQYDGTVDATARTLKLNFRVVASRQKLSAKRKVKAKAVSKK